MNEPNATTTATGSDVENILVSVSKHDLNKLEAAYARSLDRIEKLETALWDERLSALDVDDGLVAALARVARLEEAARGAVHALEQVEYDVELYCPWCGESFKAHKPSCIRQSALSALRAALEAQP